LTCKKHVPVLSGRNGGHFKKAWIAVTLVSAVFIQPINFLT